MSFPCGRRGQWRAQRCRQEMSAKKTFVNANFELVFFQVIINLICRWGESIHREVNQITACVRSIPQYSFVGSSTLIISICQPSCMSSETSARTHRGIWRGGKYGGLRVGPLIFIFLYHLSMMRLL
jgi:hypothetical protein